MGSIKPFRRLAPMWGDLSGGALCNNPGGGSHDLSLTCAWDTANPAAGAKEDKVHLSRIN